MCGIVGAIAGRDIVPVLIEGLKRLEYRGYDSAGIAVLDSTGKITRAQKGKRHILTKKSAKRKRQLRGKTLVSPSDHARLNQMLP